MKDSLTYSNAVATPKCRLNGSYAKILSHEKSMPKRSQWPSEPFAILSSPKANTITWAWLKLWWQRITEYRSRLLITVRELIASVIIAWLATNILRLLVSDKWWTSNYSKQSNTLLGIGLQSVSSAVNSAFESQTFCFRIAMHVFGWICCKLSLPFFRAWPECWELLSLLALFASAVFIFLKFKLSIKYQIAPELFSEFIYRICIAHGV